MRDKGFIYCRQSSGDEEVSLSIEVQIEQCRKLAEDRNIEIADTFTDHNIGGRYYPYGYEELAKRDTVFQNWLNSQYRPKGFREGLGKLLKRISEVKYVICSEQTRLFRPLNNGYLESAIMGLLEDHHVKILQVQGDEIDLSKFDSQLIATLKNRILSEDVEKKRRNSILGLKKRRDSGRLPTGAQIYGVVYEGDKILFESTKGKLIQYAFKRFLEYAKYADIMYEISKKYPKAEFKCFTTLWTIVRNPIYCGFMYNSEQKLIKNIQVSEPLVSFEQWNGAQKIIERRRQKNPHARPKKTNSVFSGLMFCPNCGYRMILNSSNSTASYYICKHRGQSEAYMNCTTSVRYTRVKRGNGIGLYDVGYPFVVLALINHCRRLLSQPETNGELEKLEIGLHDIKVKREQMTSLFQKNLVTFGEYEQFLQTTQGEMQKAEREILTRRNQAKRLSSPFDQNISLSRAFHDARSRTLPDHIYRKLIYEVVEKVIIHEDCLEFQTSYGNASIPKSGNQLYQWDLLLDTMSDAPDDPQMFADAKFRVVFFSNRYGKLTQTGKIDGLEIWES